MAKVTKEQKLADIEEARKLYEEADKLIKKADSLIARGLRSVQFCGHYEFETLKYPREYDGMIQVHLFSGILKLEKLLGVKTSPSIRVNGKPDTAEKSLCVGGIRFYQLGDVTQTKVNYKYR